MTSNDRIFHFLPGEILTLPPWHAAMDMAGDCSDEITYEGSDYYNLFQLLPCDYLGTNAIFVILDIDRPLDGDPQWTEVAFVSCSEPSVIYKNGNSHLISSE